MKYKSTINRGKEKTLSVKTLVYFNLYKPGYMEIFQNCKVTPISEKVSDKCEMLLLAQTREWNGISPAESGSHLSAPLNKWIQEKGSLPCRQTHSKSAGVAG